MELLAVDQHLFGLLFVMFEDNLMPMVTITLENGSGLDKTHFKDVDELLAYLDLKTAEKLPHEDQSFMEELERRVTAYRANPEKVTLLEETIEKLRARKR